MQRSPLFLCVLSLALLRLSPLADDEPTGNPKQEKTQNEKNVASFLYVWNRVQETHWDPKLGGVDWKSVRDELRPKIDRAQSIGEARVIISEMLARLGQSHFAIIPSSVYSGMKPKKKIKASTEIPGKSTGIEPSEMAKKETEKNDEEAEDAEDGEAGFDVRIIDDYATVFRVSEKSAAERAGIQRGWRLLAVNGDELSGDLAAIREQNKDRSVLEVMQVMAIKHRLKGAAGSHLSLKFSDGEDKPRDLTLELSPTEGFRTQFGHMPEVTVKFEKSKIGGIGYITFNIFMDPANLSREFGSAVAEFMGETVGIVLDLRGNPGGLGAMAMGMSGWFCEERGKTLGTMTMRGGAINFVVFPRAQTYSGPLAILVDGCSASTAEILAQGLKDVGRARIFGSPTCGAALPSVFEKLPNGDRFQYAMADYVSSSGHRLEGQGVLLDERVAVTREDLLAGKDAIFLAAKTWIEQQTEQ